MKNKLLGLIYRLYVFTAFILINSALKIDRKLRGTCTATIKNNRYFSRKYYDIKWTDTIYENGLTLSVNECVILNEDDGALVREDYE